MRAESELTVYTTTASEDLKLYRERFNKVHPDIEIRWVRDSTGIITSKLLSEKDNPQADVVHILASTSMMIMAGEGMFHPYQPEGYDKIDAKFKDRDDPPNWVGNFAYIGTVCFNEVEAEKKNLPKPESWKDLLDPVYKGHVVMSNPNSSAPATSTSRPGYRRWARKRRGAFSTACTRTSPSISIPAPSPA